MAYDEFIVTTRADRSKSSGRRFWYGVADSFFRRWPLYLLPLVLLVGVGVLQARKVTAQYRSGATLNVATNPLLSTTPLGNTGVYGFETPATATTRMINEQLNTDVFVRSVAEDAGLRAALDLHLVKISDVRARVGASSRGDRLLTVSASWSDARTATQLVNSVIKAYTDHVLAVETSQSSEAETYWTDLANGYTRDVADAQQKVEDYIVAHPAPKIGDRPTEETLALSYLSSAVTKAQTQLTNAETKISDAKLNTQQLTSQTTEGLQVVDPAEVPSAPQAIHRAQALALAVYLFLGFLLVVLMLVVSTLLDRAVRSVDDVDRATGLAVVATIPSIAVLSRRVESQVSRNELGVTNA
jgi:capsular polysaccharide biosynthesis protein